MLCQKGPDLSDVVKYKPARSSSSCNLVFESRLVIKDYTQISDWTRWGNYWWILWIVKSCCRVGVAGKTRSSVFARLSCRWCTFIHAEMFSRQPVIRAATVGPSGWNMLNGEENGSKNWSLRNPSDQFMCFGYLPSYYILLYTIFK